MTTQETRRSTRVLRPEEERPLGDVGPRLRAGLGTWLKSPATTRTRTNSPNTAMVCRVPWNASCHTTALSPPNTVLIVSMTAEMMIAAVMGMLAMRLRMRPIDTNCMPVIAQ